MAFAEAKFNFWDYTNRLHDDPFVAFYKMIISLLKSTKTEGKI